MKLVDEAVAPVVHAGTIDETKAARRKASPESGGAYPGLTSKWCLWTYDKRTRVRWRQPPAFPNTSPVLPKALLQGGYACLLFYFRPSHLPIPYRRHRACLSPRYPHPT